MSTKVLTWLIWGASLVFGRYAGSVFLIPAAITAVAYFACKRAFPADKQFMVPAISCHLGAFGWMLLGAILAPVLFQKVGFDLVLMATGLIWLYLSRGRAAAIALILYNCLALFVFAYDFAAPELTSTVAKALIVHGLWHGAAIVLLSPLVRARGLTTVDFAGRQLSVIQRSRARAG
jgi:hypothetical protein